MSQVSVSLLLLVFRCSFFSRYCFPASWPGFVATALVLVPGCSWGFEAAPGSLVPLFLQCLAVPGSGLRAENLKHRQHTGGAGRGGGAECPRPLAFLPLGMYRNCSETKLVAGGRDHGISVEVFNMVFAGFQKLRWCVCDSCGGPEGVVSRV